MPQGERRHQSVHSISIIQFCINECHCIRRRKHFFYIIWTYNNNKMRNYENVVHLIYYLPDIEFQLHIYVYC